MAEISLGRCAERHVRCAERQHYRVSALQLTAELEADAVFLAAIRRVGAAVFFVVVLLGVAAARTVC